MRNEPYKTPPGYYDVPYIYAYDGSALTDGLTYRNVTLDVGFDNAGFVLRQISGRPTIAGRVQVRDSFAPLTAAEEAGIAMPATYPICPEREYRPNSIINFDLFTVARANNAALQVIIYYPQLAFQGVRRYQGGATYPGPSGYKHYAKPFSYTINVAVTWAGTDPNPRRFVIPVDDLDFVLHSITAVRTARTGVASYAVPFGEFQLKLYDARPRELSNIPVNDFLLIDNAPATGGLYNPVFPVPGVLYVTGSVIQFDIVSLQLAGWLPAAYEITFHGERRVPC